MPLLIPLTITYFVSIADKITENLKSNIADQDSIKNSINLINKSATNLCPTINWSYTLTAEVKRIIKSLKSKNSSGYENIPVRMLECIFHFVSPNIHM
jgi:hypothetical protein